ncbi:MAG: hypothetical protein DRN17_07645 [Thermoplasmata archaeon]|nr:MAG: hypothetical protein DRN17_07645 [Thermoplasmata archaeon]
MPVYVSKDWHTYGGLVVVSAETFEDAVKKIVNSDIIEEHQGRVIKNLREIKEGEILYEHGGD